jgi:hypothetical protein
MSNVFRQVFSSDKCASGNFAAADDKGDNEITRISTII